MKIFKGILWFLILVLVIVVAVNYQLVVYGFSQLTGQLHIVCNAVPTTAVINNSATPDSVKEKLIYIDEARRFAIDSLGLENSHNYTTYFDQKNRDVMWVVTASEPYELKAKDWWFPVIGTVEYKGFFIEAKALNEIEELQDEGYETGIYSPAAWSTLGFFTDPVLSGILNRGPGQLAELIIHELTHATVYLKSSVDFNENFATFVGEQGAQQFLKNKYGENSMEHQRYKDVLNDNYLYNQYMIGSARRLDSLYHTFTPNMPIATKENLKQDMIRNMISGIASLNFSDTIRRARIIDKHSNLNNTDFLAFLRYHGNQKTFENALQRIYSGDLRKMISDVVGKTSRGESVRW